MGKDFYKGTLLNKEIAEKWMKQAYHDLLMAERNIQIEGYDIASFLSHQAVEKLLKAIFALSGEKIPKTHYIDELGRKLHLPEEIQADISDLTVDYTFARYPDIAEHVPYEEYDEATAKEKVTKAKTIFKYLEKNYSISEE